MEDDEIIEKSGLKDFKGFSLFEKNVRESLESARADEIEKIQPKGTASVVERIREHNLIPAFVLAMVSIYGAFVSQPIITIVCILIVMWIVWVKAGKNK